MKTAILYVFTGTGNTLTAAELTAKALEARGIATTVYRVKKPFSNAPDPSGYDMAGFAYPIHAFNTPQFFLRFIKALPGVQNKPAFIIKTSGEPFRVNGASSWPLVRILRKKGFLPGLDRHLLMPYNVMFRYNDALVKQMYEHTASMAEVVADDVCAENWKKLTYNPFVILFMWVFRLQWFGAWINGPMIHAKRDLCMGCGVCSENCPACNIVMKDGRPKFGVHCTMCMSCAMRCPKDAVRPGFLNPWRVNGPYPFKKLLADPNVPDTFVNNDTKGYFRLFNKYYDATYREIAQHEAMQDTAKEAEA